MNDSLTKDIHDFPSALRVALEGLHEARARVANCREWMREIEDAEFVRVYSLKAANTDRPVYPDDRLREIAVRTNLADNDEYTYLREKLDAAEHEWAARAAHYEGLRAAFRIALIDYEQTRLGHRGVLPLLKEVI